MPIDDTYFEKVLAAADFLKSHLRTQPEVVVILGTGQDLLPEAFASDGAIDYTAIPNFPKATVSGHRGRFLHGRLGEKHCLVLQGRLHGYEGYDPPEITLPLRAIALLGVKALLITNTAGGLNLSFAAGDIMAITDHINLLGSNPLRGPNLEEWGPRFPDMSRAYSRRIMAIAETAATRLGIRLQKGVYVATPGPSLETPAETRFLRNCGGDAVGMSTVPEVIVAIHSGLEVFALSVIANVNDPDRMQPIILDEVIEQVKKSAKATRQLLAEIIKEM